MKGLVLMSDLNYHVTIGNLPVGLRPREKMINEGPAALSNRELLAILLRTGTVKESALDIADKLLIKFNGLKGLMSATVEDFMGLKGIGMAKSTQVLAAVELAKRVRSINAEDGFRISSPHDVVDYIMEDMRYLDREQFRIILLNTKGTVLAMETVSIGGLNNTCVHPREVFKTPIKRSAASIILVHNHPSGDSTPSSEDISVTKRLIEAGKIIGIEILDHIIIGDNKYCSIREQGLM